MNRRIDTPPPALPADELAALAIALAGDAEDFLAQTQAAFEEACWFKRYADAEHPAERERLRHARRELRTGVLAPLQDAVRGLEELSEEARELIPRDESHGYLAGRLDELSRTAVFLDAIATESGGRPANQPAEILVERLASAWERCFGRPATLSVTRDGPSFRNAVEILSPAFEWLGVGGIASAERILRLRRARRKSR